MVETSRKISDIDFKEIGGQYVNNTGTQKGPSIPRPTTSQQPTSSQQPASPPPSTQQPASPPPSTQQPVSLVLHPLQPNCLLLFLIPHNKLWRLSPSTPAIREIATTPQTEPNCQLASNLKAIGVGYSIFKDTTYITELRIVNRSQMGSMQPSIKVQRRSLYQSYGFLSTCWACSANGPVTSTCSASGLDGKFHLWPHLFCLKFINFTHNLSKFSSKLLFWVNFGQFYQKWPEFYQKWPEFCQSGPIFVKMAWCALKNKWPVQFSTC